MILDGRAASDRYRILITSCFVSIEKTVTLNEAVDPSLLASMTAGAPQGLTGIPQRPTQENDAIPRVAPKWLKHDRHVSLFFI